jgi:hypothetical protein
VPCRAGPPSSLRSRPPMSPGPRLSPMINTLARRREAAEPQRRDAEAEPRHEGKGEMAKQSACGLSGGSSSEIGRSASTDRAARTLERRNVGEPAARAEPYGGSRIRGSRTTATSVQLAAPPAAICWAKAKLSSACFSISRHVGIAGLVAASGLASSIASRKSTAAASCWFILPRAVPRLA